VFETPGLKCDIIIGYEPFTSSNFTDLVEYVPIWSNLS
jgi:hypothetical protein